MVLVSDRHFGTLGLNKKYYALIEIIRIQNLQNALKKLSDIQDIEIVGTIVGINSCVGQTGQKPVY